jgi:hypothetical protein
MALNCIADPKPLKPQKEVEVALNNVYRLLQAFRNDAFFGLELDAFPRSQGPAANLTLRPPVERNVRDVRNAIDQAISTAFPGRSRDQAIDAVEGVLRLNESLLNVVYLLLQESAQSQFQTRVNLLLSPIRRAPYYSFER